MDDAMNPPTGRPNQGWVYHDRIGPEAAGQRVLDFYAGRYPHSSRETWRVRIEAGRVRVDGEPLSPDQRIQAGWRLTYHRPPWREPDVPREIRILYEDADLLAVAKPSGLPVLPGGGFLEHTLLHLLRGRVPEGAELSPVHRLGRGTSGLTIFARSPVARRRLSEDLREGRMRKIYRALASGISMPDAFEVDHPIGRVPYPGLRYLYVAVKEGKPARTRCRVLFRDLGEDRTLLEVEIPTGRPHQIRIHLAVAGCPLAGDPLYRPGGLPAATGEGTPLPLPGDCGYHLHATTAVFVHPVTGRPMRITAPPPARLLMPGEA
jgi:23S rRNA pseudouridine1911/1915/1917 synthase